MVTGLVLGFKQTVCLLQCKRLTVHSTLPSSHSGYVRKIQCASVVSPAPRRRPSLGWWWAPSWALAAAPDPWRCCRSGRCSQSPWCRRCSRERCGRGGRPHNWGTIAGCCPPGPSSWWGTTSFCPGRLTAPTDTCLHRSLVKSTELHLRLGDFIAAECQWLTRHLTFMPSMYFFSGFFSTMSDRCVRGTRPLIWSDTCTIMPWFSRTDTVPLARERGNERHSDNS